MNDNQEPKRKPGDIVAEAKLRKWLEDVGLEENIPLDASFIESPIAYKGFDGIQEMMEKKEIKS